MTKEAALLALQSKFEITEYVVARELHEDGSPHLHIFMKVDKKVTFKSDKFDLGAFHGNY